MKKSLIIFILLISILGNVFAGGPLLKIENEKFTLQDFLKDYKTFVYLNQPKRLAQKTYNNKQYRKQFFYQNYLTNKIVYRYVIQKYLKNRIKLKKAFKRILLLNAVSNYMQTYHVGRHMKKPTDAQLKKIHKHMIKKGMIKRKFRNAPFKKVKPMVERVYQRQMQQLLLMNFIAKVQAANRIIYNDDLENDLINKYVNGKYTPKKMKAGGKRLWLMKFNNHVISMYDVERDLNYSLIINANQKDIKKYKKSAAFRKKIRKMFFNNFSNMYFLYFYALEKKYLSNPKHKRGINMLYQTQVGQAFLTIKFKPKAKKPTLEAMKVFYKRYKKTRFKKVTFAQAKNYIKNFLMRQQLQRYQKSLFERLKNRYKYKVNANLLN